MQILWILFWGSSQNWTIVGVHFYAFTGIFLVQGIEQGYFLCVAYFFEVGVVGVSVG